MKRNLRPAAVSTKLVVVLVILVIIAGVVTIVRWSGNEYDEAVAEYLEKDFHFWCPECQEEFTMSGIEARKLPMREGEDGQKLRECPKCKQLVLMKGGQPRPEPKPKGEFQVLQP